LNTQSYPCRVPRALVASLVAASMGAVAAPAAAHHPVDTDAVSEWNATAGRAAVATGISPVGNPLHESRLYAMTQIAIHDALNSIHRRSEPYAFAARARRHTSVDAAIAAAARGVMVPVLQQPPFGAGISDAVALVEADYAAAVDAIPEGRAKRNGLTIGRAAAAAIVALRADDGADTLLVDAGYPQGDAPGEYRFTPGFTFAFAPGWGEVTPFALYDASQFRAPPPYRVTSRRFAADFNEVKSLGSATSSTRTPDQTEIARFWIESSPLQWNRIARAVAEDRGLDPWQQARLFGLLDIALADGYIGSFETKYRYDFWRPVTAIHEAGSDGNRRTQPDPGWMPLDVTPPIPDHDSAHAVEGGAGSTVLRRVFGSDHVAFSGCSSTVLTGTLPAGADCDGDAGNVLRRQYTSFSHAARENGLSRIYVGWHFRKAVDDGIRHGRRIGKFAVANYMRPLHH